MVTHSSILVWVTPMDREAWRVTVYVVAESDMTKHNTYTYTHVNTERVWITRGIRLYSGFLALIFIYLCICIYFYFYLIILAALGLCCSMRALLQYTGS